MKKYLYFILILFSFLTANCEEVIEVDLDTATEKLVIDANLYIDSENANQTQIIKLSKTVAFYATNYQPVLNAQVWIEDDLGNRYDFIDNNQNGNYECNLFVMNLVAKYTLNIISNGEIYKAEESFYQTPNIEAIEQKNDAGFLGNSFEFKIWFQDDISQQNYYQLIDDITGNREFSVKDDTFSNGNFMDFTVIDSDIEVNQNFNISFSETSKAYYLYMSKILSVSQGASNPFSSPIGEIRGNIININNPDNYPLGFFSLNNTINKTILVQ